MAKVTGQRIVSYIKDHPGCIRSLYGKDQDLIDEGQLLNPGDWVEDSTDGEDVYWVNENISWGDGILFCYEDGKVSFEEI